MSKRTRISDYRPDLSNANAHNERGMRMLEDSIADSGLGRSIVVDRNGIIIAGNATQERAVDQGFEDAIEVETEGNELVVVRRKDLDLLDDPDFKAKLLALRDNRVSEINLTWKAEQLEADRLAGVPLEKVWQPYELYQLGLQADGEFDPYEHWQGMPEFESQDLTAKYSVMVCFETIENMQTFAQFVNQPLTEKTKTIWFPKRERETLNDRAWADES